jgi:ribosomal protein S18 acetylase RimI-like enzyme
MEVQVTRAHESDLESLLPLFNSYRRFYKQAYDNVAARAYLHDRMRNEEAVIYMAVHTGNTNQPVGFVLLYPTFDSVDLAAIWVLHDLYVEPDHRQQGTGRLLMNAARDHCLTQKITRIDLSTATDNDRAQALYDSLGYERDNEFYHYSLKLHTPDA